MHHAFSQALPSPAFNIQTAEPPRSPVLRSLVLSCGWFQTLACDGAGHWFSLRCLLMGLIPAPIHREAHTIAYKTKCWASSGEKSLCFVPLSVSHSRHLLSLGCKFVVFLLQAPNPQWSLQQKPSISDSACWGCISCFEVPYNLSGSYPKNVTQTWECFTMLSLRCYWDLLLSSPFIFLLLLINEQHSSVHWGVVRDEILGMIFKYPGMS